MDCETCNALLSSYRNAVSAFKSAVQNLAGAIGADFTQGAAEVERLRRNSHGADERLIAHWRQDHPELAKSLER